VGVIVHNKALSCFYVSRCILSDCCVGRFAMTFIHDVHSAS